MTQYTRGEAAGLLAVALAAPGAKDWLTGWSSNEIQCGVGCSHPQNNLWACGQAAPGASDWNSAGVKNYPSLTEAIAAMAANLADSHYPAYQAMVHDIQQGIYDSNNVVQGLQTWCGSTCYSGSAGQFVSEGQAHSGDLFDDSSTDSTPISGDTSSQQCVPCGAAGLACCSPNVCWNAISQSVTTGALGVCTPPTATSTLNAGVPAWLRGFTGFFSTPGNILKTLLGVGLLVFGAILIGAILLDKGANTPVVKQAAKVAAVVGG